MKTVIGIGNALTDMLVNLESDSVLTRFGLAKGSMSLVDETLQKEISKSVSGLPYTLSLGGSADNTIRAMARLGCKVGFIGKVGHDTTGDFFESALQNLGIEPFILRGKQRSGKCVSLVSPDGERTMVTHLGAAVERDVHDQVGLRDEQASLRACPCSELMLGQPRVGIKARVGKLAHVDEMCHAAPVNFSDTSPSRPPS